MKVLILDDRLERQLFLTSVVLRMVANGELAGNVTIYTACDVAECTRIFGREKFFDLIFLDHDLGGRVYVDSHSTEETGYQVAKLINSWKVRYNRLIIHSMNPAGAQAMQAILKGSEWIPYIDLVELLKKQEDISAQQV